MCGKGFKQKAHMQKHLSSHRQKGEVAGQVYWMGNPMEDPKDPKMEPDHIMIDHEWPNIKRSITCNTLKTKSSNIGDII